MSAKLFQSRPVLCDPMDCSPPGLSIHAILQARILEWVAVSSSRDPWIPPPSLHRDQTHACYVSCTGRWVFFFFFASEFFTINSICNIQKPILQYKKYLIYMRDDYQTCKDTIFTISPKNRAL